MTNNFNFEKLIGKLIKDEQNKTIKEAIGEVLREHNIGWAIETMLATHWFSGDDRIYHKFIANRIEIEKVLAASIEDRLRQLVFFSKTIKNTKKHKEKSNDK